MSESLLSLWRVLPVELRLEILQHVVPNNKLLTSTCTDGVYPHQDSRTLQDNGHIRALLSIPEIRNLVMEALYTQNTVRLDFLSNRYTLLPPLRFRARARKLEIDIAYLTTSNLNLLVGIANGTLGFSKFFRIDILIVPASQPEHFKQLKECVLQMGTLEFPTCKVKVKYRHVRRYVRHMWIRDDLESTLLDKLTVRRGMSNAKETFERYFDYTYQELKEGEEWPADATYDPGRYTIKTVSV